MIDEFKADNFWLSNFAASPIRFESLNYPTVEHAYQAAKTLDQSERLQIAELKTPGQAKRAGRKLTLRTDWEEVKSIIMKQLLRLKFSKEPFKSRLLATGSEHLQEGNRWGDINWGVDLDSGEGKNMLGKLIMEIRDELRQG